ncbi:hypothetical protein C8F01DRAFT_446531 [Mycena amicta]|nr:hypothetical protein C8F01DRAFT_446531 [Mycena amicta]
MCTDHDSLQLRDAKPFISDGVASGPRLRLIPCSSPTMIPSTFSLSLVASFVLLAGVNAQTTITEFIGVAGLGTPIAVGGAQASAAVVPIGVLSDGKVVFTENAAVTIPGGGVGNGDAIAVQGDNDFEITAVITAVAGGQTGVATIGESCSFAAASASGSGAQAQAQPTGNCVVREDITLLGKGTAVHAATTIVATRSGFATFTVTNALPTLSDAVFDLDSSKTQKGGAAKGLNLRVSMASAVLIGAAFGAATILL